MNSKKKWTAALSVLLLPFLMVSVGCDDDDSTGGMMDDGPNIVETAIAAGNFETLVAAVQAADLAETLSGEGTFTVFAPTDAAFEKLPAGTVESLLEPANKSQLEGILLYHVVPGQKGASEVLAVSSLTTVNGADVSISTQGGDAFVNDAMIVTTDIQTSNGVIHVIDSVLLPSSMSRSGAMSMINNAINRGAPIFNAGHHSQCCDIYMDAMVNISNAGIEHADDRTMSLVSTTLDNARNTHDMTERAWVLRRGMDSLTIRLNSMKQVMPTSMRIDK